MRVSRPTLLDTLAHSAVIRALDAQAGCSCAALDATAGNGHDLCFLAAALRERTLPDSTARVLGCDVQESAVAASRARLEAEGLSAVAEVLLCGHQDIAPHLPVLPLAAVMFNLGYLPGSDKTQATAAASTRAALEALCGRLADNGVITLHCYTGHAGGQEEAKAVLDYAHMLPPRRWRVLRCADHNRDERGEVLIIVEKLPERRSKPAA